MIFRAHVALLVVSLLMALLVGACGGETPATQSPATQSPATQSPVAEVTPTPEPTPSADAGAAEPGKVHVVVFTHLEDNTPGGPIPSALGRSEYQTWRTRLLNTARLFKDHGLTWVLQPDWKFLLAVQAYDDASLTASTGGKNVLRYLREDLAVVVDPHSHEARGYNYADVAALLDALGVGGSTVIGGHVWDPTLPQFAHWERFRVAVVGNKYPSFSWRGDVLIGHGTPNHVNDPTVSGVWRPKDPDHFFDDDAAGNIVAVGGYTLDVAGISTLLGLYDDGTVPASCMLTSTYHLRPASLSSVATAEAEIIAPLETLKAGGRVVVTDFSSLVETWRADHGSSACIQQEP